MIPFSLPDATHLSGALPAFVVNASAGALSIGICNPYVQICAEDVLHID
jgi:hypothetical protein